MPSLLTYGGSMSVLIQDAINAAVPGDQIVVEAGTYHERLLIQKDGISLIGHNAVIEPPTDGDNNICTGLAGEDTQVGICVAGRDIELAAFVLEHRKVQSVRDTVEGVSIIGFDVRNFVGCNVAVVGATNTRVTENKLSEGPVYGFLTVGSINTRFADNKVASTNEMGFIGACMDNFHGVDMLNNHVSGYQYGICVQTSGANVRGNDARNNCNSIFVDPDVHGAVISGNFIGPPNPKCTGPGSVGVHGISLVSAIDSRVEGNTVEGQRNAGQGVGISIIDEKCIEPALSCVTLGNQAPPASGNVVVRNILRDNDIDLLLDTAGANTVSDNGQSAPNPIKLP
ncbi:hypothetical protein NEMBOFW57_006189 [Staphylotrichum longicolle]|uniref:Periplasmic copper-binding protein NosD beta helix domain-containing protein n=1 Tax=Staphylotrichum longicolle TaxID=669026 RepID=A0AAD4EYG1_9PEZI|nr:hypothetical protein NEMBOFW57_006189 [Staphylotrichum longicolle]